MLPILGKPFPLALTGRCNKLTEVKRDFADEIVGVQVLIVLAVAVIHATLDRLDGLEMVVKFKTLQPHRVVVVFYGFCPAQLTPGTVLHVLNGHHGERVGL